MPEARVIPELAYREVGEAADWLCRVFGFRLRLRIGHHRAQLDICGGAVVLTEAGATSSFSHPEKRFGVMVRVDDVDSHYERAFRAGASVSGPPTDYPYGERQYSCRDPAGYVWTFSQTIADVAPESWGGSLV
ncbi:VOC family protein [Bradyrhizobium tropiciagri]|uniref:VOC family protein n=1 Tax=Bradyrhizobium tropiciagri TaxID=312253 RepID=UPI002011466A|nr:VOC family protein [Bradyrhizobium tropiciagri]